MKKLPALFLVIFSTLSLFAQVQVPFFGKISYLKGYAKEISGENFGYTSALPDFATTALLSRCTDGNYSIEWETEAVPAGFRGDYVYFAWLAAHSTGTSHGDREFDLRVNGNKVLTFKTFLNWKGESWRADGAGGVSLVFDHRMDDGAGDAHGYMYLRLPVSMVTAGKPIKLSVAGVAANSRDWYMTFKYEFGETIRLQPVSCITRDNRQPIQVMATHFGKPVTAVFLVDGKDKYPFTLQPGLNTFEIYHAAVDALTDVKVSVSGKGVQRQEFVLQLKPVTFREIYLIHHSHYDVGYSHHQLDVEKIQTRNIANALRYIERTKEYPEPARYRWNAETALSIEDFLKTATPEQAKQLEKAVKEGSIGIGATYANLMTGICQPEELFKLTEYSRQLEKKWGVQIPAGMIGDIPGLIWSTAPAFARMGVKYFSSGPNYIGTPPYEGDRIGFSSLAWKDRPFWWVSPSGNEKVLYWIAGKGYSSWHGFKPGEIGSVRGKKKISAYMDELEQQGYPYDMVQLRYNIVADNGPTDSLVSDFVRDWNLKYKSPAIRLSTVDAMFRDFEKKYGDQLPAYAGDFTPYWEDGAYSTAAEMAMNRKNSEKLTALSALYSVADPESYRKADFEEAWRKVLLWDEHTWGAFNSISDPDIPFVTSQWAFKRKYATDADSIIRKLEAGLVKGSAPDLRSLDVFNVSSWERTDAVYLDKVQTQGIGKVTDESGKPLPFQHLSDGRSVVLVTIPGLSSKRIRLEASGTMDNFKPQPTTSGTLENDRYRLSWDENTGSISSLTVKEGNTELADREQFSGLNEFLYVPGRDPGKAEKVQHSRALIKEKGPVFTTLAISSEALGCNGLEREITLFETLDRIEIRNTVDKKAVREKEAVHFAFPFRVPEARERFNTGLGGIFEPGVNQLAGSNQDYYSVNQWCDVSNQDYGVTLLLREACLVEPGAMISEVTGKYGVKEWKKQPDTRPTLFSYVMNNYWHTNFKIDQEGPVTFTYGLVPHKLFNTAETYRQGMEFNQPFFVLPAGEQAVAGPLFSLSDPNVMVTMLEPTEHGFRMRLFNAGGAPVDCRILWKAFLPGKMQVFLNATKAEPYTPEQSIHFPAFGIVEVEVIR